MHSRETDNVMHRINQALSRPIQNRCAELTVLFDRISITELQNLYPIVIDNIFGPQGSFNWGLRTTNATTNSQDFQAMQHFLSPLGPLFKLIYALLCDPLIKYEFSVAWLPLKVRQMLEKGNFHPFYQDLIHRNPQTQQIVSLLLNPFDYYFFHFAYHLINPWHQRTGIVAFGPSSSTVYYVLCCDYVLHFLPTDTNPVLPFINYFCGKTLNKPLPSFNSLRSMRQSKLLRGSVLMENEYASHQTLERHPRNEIWRSETVLITFIDIWLNNDQLSSAERSFTGSHASQLLYFNEPPTAEYVRIIRVLVKQMHAFASSARADDTHMGELKKVAIPMLEGKLYVFLRNLVNRWPLDGSFRLVLELWLSFIQPWRYPGTAHLKPLNQEVNPDVEEIGTTPMKSVEREHIQFIAENLLAYVVIFQQLLPRFSRVDLASPKMSLMLYRLTKVFDQPNLVLYLREIESTVEQFSHSPTHSYHGHLNTSLPPLSPTSEWSTNTSYDNQFAHTPDIFDTTFAKPVAFVGKWNATVKQKILELEGPGFCYKPLFTSPPAKEVFELIGHIKDAKRTAELIIQTRLQEEAKEYSGFFGSIKSFLMISDGSNDEFTMEERRKVPVYLEFALQNLMDMFHISERESERMSSCFMNDSSGSFVSTDDFRFLTPEKVKERIKHLKYEGDPDLLPVGSHESQFLVTLFYRLSTKINEEFCPLMSKYYFQSNYFGRLLQQILRPPMTIYTYDKTQEGRSPRVPKYLPPRVSLRPLASHKFIAYMVIGALISNLFGYSTYAFVSLIFFSWLLLVSLKAVRTNRNQISYSDNPRNVAANMSGFNHSF